MVNSRSLPGPVGDMKSASAEAGKWGKRRRNQQRSAEKNKEKEKEQSRRILPSINKNTCLEGSRKRTLVVLVGKDGLHHLNKDKKEECHGEKGFGWQNKGALKYILPS